MVQMLAFGFAQTHAQHNLTLFDSTSVVMEESGLSHVVNHQRIRILDAQGAKKMANIKLDYDPQSAYVEFRDIKVFRNKSSVPEQISTDSVYDYVAPARLIYWGASQKMALVGHLEPGDEIEFTSYKKGFTYALLADDDSRYIPPMKGHFYDIVPFWSEQPVLHKVYQLDILRSKHIQFKAYNGQIQIDSVVRGDRILYTFTKNDIQPIEHEPGMVADNDVQCKLLLSTSPDWETKSRWFYGVNEDYGSFRPTPELQAKVNELLTKAKDELDSISILTHWVADNMRYCGITMGEGEGFTLHNAQMNFTDRCGVCKDKASLLISMLRAAGFKAYPAMTMAHERIDNIPADQFNHCVAVVERHNGSLQPLDPTWVPNVRELWSSAEQQQGYLPGIPQGSDLLVTPISPAENHYIRIFCLSSIDKNGNLEADISITAEGQSDAAVRRVFSAQKSEWLNRLVLEIRKISPQAQIRNITYTDPEHYLDQPITITYKFKVPDYAIADGKNLTFAPFSARGFFASAMSHLFINTDPEQRKYPFTDACSRLVEINETISLPKGFTRSSNLPEDITITSPAASFQSSYALDENTFIFSEKISLNKRIYDAEDWPDFRNVVLTQKANINRFVTISK